MGSKILQLAPVLGNIYNVDCVYYAPLADIVQGFFTALLAFALEHDHPITINNCPDLAAFQVAHPLVVIYSFLEAPPA